MIATLVYLLCGLTSALCAVLLWREYRRSGTRLLLWSSVSFIWFALSNALAFADYVVFPHIDLSPVRPPLACIAIGVLLYGLVWDVD